MNQRDDILHSSAQVSSQLERCGVRVMLVGGLAASLYGVTRPITGADLLADIQPMHANRVVAALRGAYALDTAALEAAIVEAQPVRPGGAVRNPAAYPHVRMAHHRSQQVVTLYLPGVGGFDQAQFRRRVRTPLDDTSGQTMWVAALEDVVIAKLRWMTWHAGDQAIEDRQWDDVQAMLVRHGRTMNMRHVREWCAQLRLTGLLEAALRGERPAEDDQGPEQLRLF